MFKTSAGGVKISVLTICFSVPYKSTLVALQIVYTPGFLSGYTITDTLFTGAMFSSIEFVTHFPTYN